ncbi:MAG TPA: non-homologous end-joining DNA ligase [Opitutaceae bacterium]|nr:non-homologous end-joining DNA ligase [Opitutaceae bacterium]
MTRRAQPKVKFTNLEKVLFPAVGFTKGEVIDYYVAVAPFILPHLRRRPVSLVRFPDGVRGEKFYAKNAPSFTPDWVHTFAVPRTRHAGKTDYIVIDDAPTLAWCANLAAIELHPFLHRAPRLDRPTHIVFDLDPGEGADLRDCAEVAFHVKAIADTLGLTLLPKVSGSKGLQLYVPINTTVTYAATGAFAKAVAQLLEQEHPDLVVSRMAKSKRRGRVLIDWSQNHAAKTTVAVYSLRGKRDAPYVSMPVTWTELKRLRHPESLLFEPQAALRRLKRRGDLFAPLLELRQKLPRDFTAGRAKSPPAALAAYSAKRDFSRTREPAPATAAPASGGAPRFVIQKHAASQLHYDLRLEMDGTLKSWAVPKGLPRELHVKRSAFAVEDHPLGYIDFEGTIPKGQYGGGTVMVWDIGTYELLGGAYADGNLKIRFAGRKLRGDWHLFKIRSERGKDVWLVAKSGEAATPLSAKQDDTSVLSGRGMAEIAEANDAVWDSDRAS